MKNILLLILLSFALNGFAQSKIEKQKARAEKQAQRLHENIILASIRCQCPRESRDTIFDAGEPQFVLKKFGTNYSNHIFDIQGNHIFTTSMFKADNDHVRYVKYTNITDNTEAYFFQSIDYKGYYKALVKGLIIVDGKFSPQGWKAFAKANTRPDDKRPREPRRSSLEKAFDRALSKEAFEDEELVGRDRTKGLVCSNNEIYQDEVLIGTYLKKQENQEGTLFNMFNIRYRSNKLCALIKIAQGPTQSTIRTTKDGQTLVNDSKDINELVKVLVDKGYL
ncbi:MAG: hypothetical protein MRY83_23885 [Flavobacteriales bacterium]|nr:hypothetical protein [Flavobacteriales bacterium]